MTILAVIPARWASTRLPGKPLIEIKGKPMVQHVWENAKKSKLIDEVLVATDDKRVFDCVTGFGGKAVMTEKKHQSGTDRIGELAKKIKCDIIVNIQGDEPFISPTNIDKAIQPLLTDKKLNVSTLCFKIKDKKEITDPNVVKAVMDNNNNALYFSRNPVPYYRDGNKKVNYYKHIGLYVYRKNYLLKLIRLKQTKAEKAEKLEQLRILESGERIKVVVTKTDSISIDTRADLKNLKQNY